LAEILLYLLSFGLGIAIPAAIVRWDVARLSGERLARAWPDASLWSAVVAFGPLCVPIHFLRTRRNWAGLDLALFWLAVTLFLVTVPGAVLGWLLGVED
jgi:hypothetical protein